MTKRMLIDAGHPEETRVVIVDGTKVEELDFESAAKKQLRGNLYLARVTRVEPSLQAAFVEYGGNRHGFLAFSEIHPDYYQIPYEDRMALLEAEEAEALEDEAEEEAEDEAEKQRKTKPKRKPARSRKAKSKTVEAETDSSIENEDLVAEESEQSDDIANDDEAHAESGEDIPQSEEASESEDLEETDDKVEAVSEDADEDVAEEQEKTAKRRRTRSFRNRYKIQEVIKRGQILLIQVVKEERGNKGAAMTTYLSLAGRYCVLMPNTPKGGGISRKISNGSDRKRLKSIVSEFEVPQGMGVIVRTAGAKRTKAEVKRDYDYLCRLWETIRDKTLKSIAPALIHEEGDLVKRSIRDLYNKDIKEVLVQGEDAYKSAKDFIKMLMPSHAKNVKAYKEEIPLFLRYQVESQIEESLESVVQLKSGGYLVIHPTEALVSVDVNSGRSTKERNVERTALKTNLEAAVEVARQMRLRDLAGLVVIDFIDMDEYRNNRAVEKKMKEALSRDRARVQAGRISQFGLMEISRQRRRRSLLEGSTISCPHCEGVGRKRTVESSALKALRAIEELAARAQTVKARLKVAPDVAAFILNHKREQLQDIHEKFGMYAVVEADPEIMSPEFVIDEVQKRKGKTEDPLATIEKELKKEKSKAEKSKSSKASNSTQDEEDIEDDQDDEPKKRRRRGRRGGRRRKSGDNDTENSDSNPNAEEEIASQSDESVEDNKAEDKKPKRRSRRRSSKKENAEEVKTEAENASAQSEDDSVENNEPKPKRRRSRTKAKKADQPSEDGINSSDEPVKKTRRRAPKKATKSENSTEDAPQQKDTKEAESDKVEEKKSTRSTTRRKAPGRKSKDPEAAEAENNSTESEEAPKKKAPRRKKKTTDDEKDAESKESGKKRTGWWSRKR